MFKKVIKKLLTENKKPSSGRQDRQQPVDADLNQVMRELKQHFGQTSDLVLRKLLVGSGTTSALVVYLENMVDLKVVNESIIAKLQVAPAEMMKDIKVLAYSVLAVHKVNLSDDMNQVIQSILEGSTVIFIGGAGRAMIAVNPGYEKRSISSPEIEVNVEGPREAFIESRPVNLTMVRRRIKDSNLRFENFTIGTRSNTTVTLGYLQGITDPGIVEEARRRLKSIKIDGFLGMEIIQEYLKDQPLSVFPTIMKTERPEKVAACLLEGRVAIFADGYPYGMVAPITFTHFLQAGDDYYENFYFATFVRWMRILVFITTLTLPSLYVALVTHHWEMMPTSLALSIAGGREGVPFPVLVEALAMEFIFEILREAGVRLPRAVGQAVSIVGALVIGQSAVQAGLVSPGIVIVVAFTGIASFAIPIYTASIPFRILRFPLMVISSQVGIPGLVAGVLVIWGHMTSLTSFGVPYLAPLMPFQAKDMKDSLFRVPRWAMVTRPQSVPSMDPDRLDVYNVPPGEKNK